MKLLIKLIFSSSLFLMSVGHGDHEITKRSSFYLLFPRNTVLQITYGLTVPYVLPRRSINLTWGFQAQYVLPFNVSNFAPMTIAVRSNTFTFDLPRIKFYQYLAKLLDNFGLNGLHCVLRSVCEVADVPMYEKDDSVLEKIVHFIFTPSLELKSIGKQRNSTIEMDDILSSKLLQAENRGKLKGNCEEKYSKCMISLIDLMTVLYIT
ncbi:hypothetical protein ABEB36_006693 [Hypothenemus hampei]|uniref:Uncharacterized protein n=1 Tax=Hypothenemus hampei TaxID=57062 RepID=A0ABD1EUG4_HYPHA